MNSRSRIRQMSLVGILTALSVVVSAWLKIPLFGNVKLDLSYIVLTIAIMKCNKWGAMFVGGVGALIESLLFAANGLSISWAFANVTIAFIASFFYELSKQKGDWLFIVGIIVGCTVGLILLKSTLETVLFDIPFFVRLPRNSVAFLSDAACMIIGFFIGKRVLKDK